MIRASLVGKELGYISGLIDAKGYIGVHHYQEEDIKQVLLSSMDLSVVDKYTGILANLSVAYSIASSFDSKGREVYTVTTASLPHVSSLLEHLYLISSKHKLSAKSLLNKDLPSPINEDSSVVIGWLAGLMDASASIQLSTANKTKISLTCEPEVTAVVKYGLGRLGIMYREYPQKHSAKSIIVISKGTEILKFYSLLPIQSLLKVEMLERLVELITNRTRYKLSSEYLYKLHTEEGLNLSQVCKRLGIDTNNSGRLCRQLESEGYSVVRGINRSRRKDSKEIIPVGDLGSVYQRLLNGESARSILRSYDKEKEGSTRLLNQLTNAGYDTTKWRRSVSL